MTGPNGAGKSTLMSTIAGEIEPVEGEVRVAASHGAVDPAAPEGAGAVTFLVDPSFFPDLTIGEHLEITAHQVGVPADELRDSVAPWQISDIESELPSRVPVVSANAPTWRCSWRPPRTSWSSTSRSGTWTVTGAVVSATSSSPSGPGAPPSWSQRTRPIWQDAPTAP